MPTWVCARPAERRAGQAPSRRTSHFDVVRRHLRNLAELTKRGVILYGVDVSSIRLTSVSRRTSGIAGCPSTPEWRSRSDPALPGRFCWAAEAIVSYLRSKFSDIRVIVPHAAMSAASRWRALPTALWARFVPRADRPSVILAGDITYGWPRTHHGQFRMAPGRVCQGSGSPWLPILRQTGQPCWSVQLHTQLAGHNLSWLRSTCLLWTPMPRQGSRNRGSSTTARSSDALKVHPREG
jgi:hypothetical protein